MAKILLGFLWLVKGKMELNDGIRNFIEIGFGILFLIGAIFNSLYTLRNGEGFYGDFADKALLRISRNLIRKLVIPLNKVFTILLITFQITVAISILSRGVLVGPGFMAGVVFSFAVIFVSNPTGMIVSLVMSVVLLYLGTSQQISLYSGCKN